MPATMTRSSAAVGRALEGRRLRTLPAVTVQEHFALPVPKPTGTEIAAELVVEGEVGTQRIPLLLRRRPRRDRWTWAGTSSDGRYDVSLTCMKPSTWTLQIKVADEPTSVRAMLAALDEMRALARARSVGLAMAGDEVELADAMTSRLDLAPGYEPYLRALARLADHLGRDLPVPEQADAEHVHDVVVAGALLDGASVRESYEAATLLVDSEQLDDFRDGPLGSGPVQVVCRQTWQVHVSGELVELPIEVTYLSAHVPDWPLPGDEAFARVQLRPHKSSEAILRLDLDGEHRLILTPLPRLIDRRDDEAPLFDGPIDADWSGDHGKWVAVLGGRVVAHAATPRALLAVLADADQPYETLLPLRDAVWNGTPSGL